MNGSRRKAPEEEGTEIALDKERTEKVVARKHTEKTPVKGRTEKAASKECKKEPRQRVHGRSPSD